MASQGDGTQSAGNTFVKLAGGLPSDYIDLTGSAAPEVFRNPNACYLQYYYGPSEAYAFLSPYLMNIPKIQALADQACTSATYVPCPNPFIGIEESEKTDPGS